MMLRVMTKSDRGCRWVYRLSWMLILVLVLMLLIICGRWMKGKVRRERLMHQRDELNARFG